MTLSHNPVLWLCCWGGGNALLPPLHPPGCALCPLLPLPTSPSGSGVQGISGVQYAVCSTAAVGDPSSPPSSTPSSSRDDPRCPLLPNLHREGTVTALSMSPANLSPCPPPHTEALWSNAPLQLCSPISGL